MAHVLFTHHGVQLARGDKQQQIWLSPLEWQGLCTLRKTLDPYMAGEQQTNDRYWPLPQEAGRDPTVGVRAVYTRYEGATYLHIRVYVNGTPTKQGVMLNASNWHSVRTAMGEGQEALLGREIYLFLLQERITDASRCEGCENGWGGQRDHRCLMQGDDPRPVDVKRFIAELAALSRTRGHVLERPLDCYKLLAEYQHAELLERATELSRKEAEDVSAPTP